MTSTELRCSRKANGLCIECARSVSKHDRISGYTRCVVCRDRRRSGGRTEQERAADLQRKKALADRWRAVQACIGCGKPTTTYRRCLDCRRMIAEASRRWYQRTKAAA